MLKSYNRLIQTNICLFIDLLVLADTEVMRPLNIVIKNDLHISLIRKVHDPEVQSSRHSQHLLLCPLK